MSAVLIGTRSLLAISGWITDAPQHVLGVLGFAADPPTGLRAGAHARAPHTAEPKVKKEPVRQVVAVDGKAIRGPRTRTATAIQLLAAVDHHGVVLAQRQIAPKSNDFPSFLPLLSGMDPRNAVVTADALHTQHGDGAHLTGCGAHDVVVVKNNHPGLDAQFRKLPWRDIPLGQRTHDRDEIRRLKVAAFSHLDHAGAGARQAIQVVRWRSDLSTGKLAIERVYVITGLSLFDATCTELATYIRGHWGIENLLHHVRDRTFREDDSKIRTGTFSRAMASLRNLAISVFHQDGRAQTASWTANPLTPRPLRPAQRTARS
ncbi:ISAs1 family transposase [Streptomyces sp. NPDC087525]|uniref:ISAs1 family transposase n=1 Tax=Streptomyces sp. NPDC087525 TaxID=3365793 RepID=UPI00381E10FB